MSKRADDDTRTEAICRHCGQTIRARRFLDSWWWEHDDDGRVLPGGPYVFCRTTTATPKRGAAPSQPSDSVGDAQSRPSAWTRLYGRIADTAYAGD